MAYVKGCDINVLSKSVLKRIADGKLQIIDGLKDVLSYEVLSSMFEEAKINFVDSNGKTVKGMPTEEIFYMTKKIDKQKYIIGLSSIKRIAGAPSGKTGLAAAFESSTDKLMESRRIFAEGYEKEEEYFDQSLIDHLRNSVGAGQSLEAEYKDKIITRIKSKKILGIKISVTLFFLIMVIVWGLLFKNIALGICFALCFVGSFTLVSSKSNSQEKTVEKED